MRSIIVGLGDAELEHDYPAHPDVPPASLMDARHVVLLVLDGLGYRHLMKQIPDGAIGSALVGRMTSVFPSTTTSAVTTFLTAEAPQQHALTGWYMWFRELGVVGAPLPFRMRAGGGDLRDLGINPHSIFDRPPTFAHITRKCFMVQPAHLCKSVYSRAHQGGAVIKPYRTLGGFFSCIRRLASAKTPSYIYAYWPELDSLGHRQGMQSEAASVHLTQLDRQVERLTEKLAGHGATLIITADHGFVDTAPRTWVELEAHPELKEMLAVPLCGEPRAAYCYVHSGRENEFLDYVREHLNDACRAASTHDMIGGGYFGLGSAHSRLRDRVGDYCLIMKGNYAIRDRLSTERKVKGMIGVHGGDSEDEMYIPLAVVPA